MVPLARLLGLKVVVTHHGPDYKRGKWSKIAKAGLWVGEWLSEKFAHEVIAISKIIQDILKKRCNRVSKIIYNGVFLPEKSRSSDFLKSFGVEPGRYILAVSRIESEKGLDVLKERYFKCGDVADLKKKIEYHLDRPVTMNEKSVFRACIREKYNWEKIAAQTVKVYEKALAE
jgi:glycosyltransferase involved in cell wall biosynthesis